VKDRLCLASSLPWPVAGRRIYITVHRMAGPPCTNKTRVLVSVQDSGCVWNSPLNLRIHMAGYCSEFCCAVLCAVNSASKIYFAILALGCLNQLKILFCIMLMQDLNWMPSIHFLLHYLTGLGNHTAFKFTHFINQHVSIGLVYCHFNLLRSINLYQVMALMSVKLFSFLS
jgi:hypothetical protein